MTKSRNILPPRVFWTDEQLRLLRELYPDNRTEDIAPRIGRSAKSIYSKAKQLGIKKSAAFLASGLAGRLDGVRGGATRFKKGQVPANKGLRRPGWAPGNMAATQFKKGRPANEARNYVPIGSLRINKDGYLERKITDDPTIYPARRWIAIHRQVWIEANGPVPDRHMVVFKKGMRTNVLEEITLDRVECISLAENMRRNTFHNYGAEVAKLVQLRGAITRQINKREGKKAA